MIKLMKGIKPNESQDIIQGNPSKDSSLLREWIGFAATGIWCFSSMFISERDLLKTHIIVLCYMLLLSISLLIVGALFGKQLSNLSKIASIATPVASVLMITMLFSPEPVYFASYLFSALLLAPQLLRRSYGLFICASENNRFITYFSAFSAVLIAFSIWHLFFNDSREIFFLIAIFAFIGSIGIKRSVPLEISELYIQRIKLKSSRMVFIAILACVSLSLLGFLCLMLREYLLDYGIVHHSIAIVLSVLLLPAAGFIVYSVLSDKHSEKYAFSFAIAVLLIGCLAALLSKNSLFQFPMLIGVGFGGIITEYLWLSMPLYFVKTSRNPVLTASLGLICFSLVAASSWLGCYILPQIQRDPRMLLIMSAIMAELTSLIFMNVFRWQNREMLMNAIITQCFKNNSTEEATINPVNMVNHTLKKAELTLLEEEIATLLIQGESENTIAEKLSLRDSSVINQLLASILYKLKYHDSFPNSTLVEKIRSQYNLTQREVDILKRLCHGKTNKEIATELFITEVTVKYHVKNLLTKLSVSSRYAAAALVKEIHGNI